MAICTRCGSEFDPADAAEEFAANDYIDEMGLAYSYESMSDLCAECAIQDVYDNYPQGIEDMSWHLGDD